MDYGDTIGLARIAGYIRREADNFTTFTFLSSITESSDHNGNKVLLILDIVLNDLLLV